MTVGDFDGKVLRHLIGYFLYHCMPLVLIVRIFMSAMWNMVGTTGERVVC